MSTQFSGSLTDFGSLLKFLRRRARLTQIELGIMVGYSEAHVSRLEHNQRFPDPATVAALFVPALGLSEEPDLAARLLELANIPEKGIIEEEKAETDTETIEIVGAIESIPALPAGWVPSSDLDHIRRLLADERCVMICGLPGSGKTTLAAALAVEISQTRPVFWLTFTEGLTASVDNLVRQLGLFSLTLGSDAAAPLIGPRDPHLRPLPLAEQLSRLSQALSFHDCLFCIDRLQLVREDTALLNALQHLAATTRASFLVTSREELPLAEFKPYRVGGFGSGEAALLMKHLGLDLTSSQVDQLVARTGGSPMLIRLAAARLREGRMEPSTLIDHLEDEAQIVGELIETTFGNLSGPARQLAEWLSVFRTPVDLTDDRLRETIPLIPAGEMQVWDQAVTSLEKGQFIGQRRRAALHPLIRDVIYASLGKDPPRRRNLHRLAGDWLAQDPEEMLRAAYHYGQAHQISRAAEVLTDQAESVASLGLTDAAVRFVDQLLEQIGRASSRAGERRALLILRGDLLANTTRAAEAEANFREALTLTEEPAVRAQISFRLAQNLVLRYQASEALKLCVSASRGLSITTYPLIRAELAMIECQARLALSQLEKVETAADRALNLAKRVKEIAPIQATQIEAQVDLALGAYHGIRGETHLARTSWQNAITAAHAVQYRSLEYRAHINLGISLYQEGDFATALEHYRAALSGAQSLADNNLEARALSNMSILHHLCGRLNDALLVAGQARDLRMKMGDRLGVANADNTRAMILLAQGHFDEARVLAGAVILEAERLGDRRLLAGYLDTLALVQLALGENQDALTTLQRALDLPIASVEIELTGDLKRHLALIQLTGDQILDASRTLGELPESGSPKPFIEQALIGGWLALLQDEKAQARKKLTAARERIEVSGCELYLDAARRLERAIQEGRLDGLRLALV